MDKQMVEEIEQFLARKILGGKAWNTRDIAKGVYELITENAVVLKREEHQKYLAFKIIEPQVRGCLDRERELEKRLETAIKETAEKFAERFKAKLTDIIPFEDYEVADWNYDGMDIENSIDEICEEVKGWNNE